MNRKLTRSAIAIGAIASALCAQPASAQTGSSLTIGVQIPVERIDALDSTDTGIGIGVAWTRSPLLSFDGELNLYPSDVPSSVAVSRSRTEGLFGISSGPRLGRWRPFVRVRPGFVKFDEAPAPVVCPLIFPPLISCSLASGSTLFALEIGGGLEFYPSNKTVLHVDIGDRMLKYPGPAIDRDGKAHDDDFFGQALRIAVGAGWRF